MKIENPSSKHFVIVFGVAFVIGSIILSIQHLNTNSAGYAGVLRIPIIAGLSLAMFPRGLITFLPSSLCMIGLIIGHIVLIALFAIGCAKRNRTVFMIYCVLLVLNILGCLVGHAPTNWAMG